MASSNLKSWFVTVAVAVAGSAAILAYKRNETAEDLYAVLLAKDYNEKEANCAKRLVKSISLVSLVTDSKSQKQEKEQQISKSCGLNYSPAP